MDYEVVLAQVLDLLQREKCLSYRIPKRRLGVDDDELEDLKEDLIYAKKLAPVKSGSKSRSSWCLAMAEKASSHPCRGRFAERITICASCPSSLLRC